MNAHNLISDNFSPLRTSDTGRMAIKAMQNYHVRHLPIVNNEDYLGLISEDEILDNDLDEPIGSYGLTLSKAFVKEDDHLFEVMRIVGEYNLTLVPVINAANGYAGVITQHNILYYFSKIAGFTESGRVLTVKCPQGGYSLLELIRIIESEGGKILNLFLTSRMNDDAPEFSIKVYSEHINNIVATLERKEYEVTHINKDDSDPEVMQDRLESLMAYLNV